MKILTGEHVAIALGVLMLSGCLRLEVATPEKPITINMNVKIEHEIQIKVDKDVENLLKNQSNLF
ncbi:YnbE family lipoprotein [Yersinia sp. 2544 StPb PI]|uniref:YnbE family lipoprotein n=1 Tax=unclassified Yersinia (in: enterobacteria) TaxID=2653513 RepID=UPI00187D3662